MSDIIYKLQSRYTGMRGIMHGKCMPLLSPCETRPTSAPTQGISEEFEMRVYIGTIFRCNPAQRQRAEEQARSMLAREMYKDVYHAIDRMRLILNDYEYPEDMMEELDKLARCISE